MSDPTTAAQTHQGFLLLAIAEAERGVREGRGGPFGAVVVRQGQVLARACNEVTSRNDPTAHAEVLAIRAACAGLGAFQLEGCEVYASCEPCPMCLGALYWARPRAVYFAASRQDAAAAGFDDAFIYEQVGKPPADRHLPFVHLPTGGSDGPFTSWRSLEQRIDY
jgi:guanine deaminase